MISASPIATHFSPCQRYRYTLTRTWPDPLLQPGHYGREWRLFVLCNPSTATAERDDPTIRRCMGFAQRWGLRGFVLVNLWAWRATQPRELGRETDAVGPENDRYIREALAVTTGPVLAAWGALNGVSRRLAPERRVLEVASFVPRSRAVHALRLTQGGAPEHPLYIPYEARPVVWRERMTGDIEGVP